MSGSCSAFFYGTLLHPLILKRVIGNDGAHLSICPAVLLEHTRHQVKHSDYPAVIPYATAGPLFGRDLTREERSVRGNLVSGLSQSDVDLLDVFEGDEYTREKVLVYALAPMEALNNNPEATITTHPAPLPAPEDMRDPIETHVYIWAAPLIQLVPELWSYAQFIRDNAWKWVGDTAERAEYSEVDTRRATNEAIARAALQAIRNEVLN